MNLEPFTHIDCHTHLNFTHFDHDQDKVIAKMKDREIGAINIGIDEKTSRESIALAESHDHIWASVGCHPTEATSDFDINAYKNLLSDREASEASSKEAGGVVAVGECGLDYSRPEYRTNERKSLQEDVFVAQIKLAAETGLPLILHIRPQEGTMDAYEDGLDILKHYQKRVDTNLTGTAHFFVGDKQIAEQFLELGFYVSFTGPITYDRRLQEVCSHIPVDRLLAETDSPFASPEPHRGKRNSPLYLPTIVEKIADCKQMPTETVASQLITNTRTLFGMSSK